MHIIKKFNRFELKYILPLEKVEELKKDLKRYVLPDPYGDGEGKYKLASLYYDSPDGTFYHEKIDGLLYRRKVRIRWYEVPEGLKDNDRVFVEIKQRVDRVTQKKRVAMPYKDALALCNEGIYPKCSEDDKETMDEIYSLIKLYNLEPTAITSYDRQAFVGTDYDMGLRITFDSHVTYRVKDLDLGAGTYEGFIVPPGHVIMEIKTNDMLPYWVAELVGAHNLKLIRISKYCTGLDNDIKDREGYLI